MVDMEEHKAEVVIEYSIQVLSSFSTFYRNIGDNVRFKCGGGTLSLLFTTFLGRFIVLSISISNLIV